MSRWFTENVVAELQQRLPNATVTVEKSYSEYCTEAVLIRPKLGKPGNGRRIHAFGFCTEREPDACKGEVEMVELSDGTDSRGGLHSTDPEIILLFAQVRVALTQMGHEVVDQMKDYF